MSKRNIKDLMPNPRSRFTQGFFDKFLPKRYYGKYPIIYRSSWEFKFMQWCESSSIVLKWTSEPPEGIPYYDVNGGYHTYYPDFEVHTTTGEVWIIEVKPKKDIPQNLFQIKTDQIKAKNAFKWKAAIAFCEANNKKFKLVTEDFFKGQRIINNGNK